MACATVHKPLALPLPRQRPSLDAAGVIKQGYLKKLPNASKPGAKFKSPLRRWFVFGVTSNRESYLDYYDREEDVAVSAPINTVSLATCRRVTRDVIMYKHPYVFNLTLSDRVLSLVAPNRDVMLDWCCAFEYHLNLKIIGSDENYYEPVAFGTNQPEMSTVTSQGQSVVRPRPRPNRGGENLINFDEDNSENERRLHSGVGGTYEPVWVGGQGRTADPDEDFMDLGVPTSLSIRSSRSYQDPALGDSGFALGQGQTSRPNQTSPSSPPGASGGHPLQPVLPPKLGRANSREIKIRGFSVREQEPGGGAGVPVTPSGGGAARRFARSASQQAAPESESPSRLAGGGSAAGGARRAALNRAASTPTGNSAPSPTSPTSPAITGAVGGMPAGRRSLPRFNEAGAAAVVSDQPLPNTPNSPDYDLSNLPDKMREALGIGDSDPGGVYGWNVPPEDETGAPPPYVPNAVFNRGSQKSLKQTQVEVLEKEMSHSGGVKVMLRRLDCHHTVALADYQGKVWIAGWNQKARPFLHNAFHVGDRLVCINGQVIENTKMAQKLIKQCSDLDKMTFIIQRVPHAKIFAVRRSENGESLGIRREGGTGEIVDVEPHGLAARHGLSAKATTQNSTNLCNWFLTEINSRPVNLFYKGDEIERRLNAVGKDISFLVQPVEFIDALKKELKSNYKSYKEFIVQ